MKIFLKTISWIKKLIAVVKNYDKDVDFLLRRINKAEALIRDRTEIHADVHIKGTNNIIVIGRYNRSYIQTFIIHYKDFSYLIQTLKDTEE